jgi:hypothetical protein
MDWTEEYYEQKVQNIIFPDRLWSSRQSLQGKTTQPKHGELTAVSHHLWQCTWQPLTSSSGHSITLCPIKASSNHSIIYIKESCSLKEITNRNTRPQTSLLARKGMLVESLFANYAWKWEHKIPYLIREALLPCTALHAHKLMKSSTAVLPNLFFKHPLAERYFLMYPKICFST